MKRLILLIGFLSAAMHPLYANIYVDAYGVQGSYADAKTQAGFGGGAGFDILQNVNVYMKMMNSGTSEKVNGHEINNYKFTAFYSEIEYLMRIKDLPLMWSASAGLGGSKVSIWDGTVDINGKSLTIDESGMFFGLWTGFRYHLTQRIGFYFNVGYHNSLWVAKKEMSVPSVKGYQIRLGITGTVWGKNSRIDEDY